MSTYLNDHLTDETFGIGLARRAAAVNKGTRLGTFLEMLSWELEADRDALLALMIELGVGRHLTTLRAAVGERVDDVDFDAQIQRAELQRELLGGRRLDVAAGARG